MARPSPSSSSISLLCWFLLFVTASYLVSRVLVPRLVFRRTCGKRSFVTAASLYQIIRANTLTDGKQQQQQRLSPDGDAEAEEDYYIHVAYDVTARTVVLLRVTPSEIVRLISYELPPPHTSTLHVRFANSWRDLKRVYMECRRQGRLPRLNEVVRLVDRRALKHTLYNDVPAGRFKRPLGVRVSSDGGLVTYTDASGTELCFRLPQQLRATLLPRGKPGGVVRVCMMTKSPCEVPDRVTYDDYKQYYRDVLMGASTAASTRDVALRPSDLQRFAWSCLDKTDMHPVLVLRSNEQVGLSHVAGSSDGDTGGAMGATDTICH